MASPTIAVSRRTMVAACVLAVLLVAGSVLTRCSNTSPSADAAPAGADAPRSQPPTGDPGSGAQAGVDVGFERDESGATAAAVTYSTASQQWLYFTDDEIRTAIDEIATPSAAPRLAAEVVRDVSMAREQLGASAGRVWWIVRPLAWRVDDLDHDQARVSVWTITVLSAAGVAVPQAEYLTVVLDLSWVDGGWRVDSARDSPGPTPMTGPQDQPWDAEPFDESLAGFTRMDGEQVQ